MRRMVSTLVLLGLGLGPAIGANEWTDLGGAHPGVNGDPELAGTGVFEPGQTIDLNLTQAAPSAQTLLLVSTSSVPAAFAGGILQAWPTVIPLIALSTNGAGSIPITAIAPPLLPPSIPFYFQYIIADAAASQGVAISNAVRALTPSLAPVIVGLGPTTGTVGTTVQVTGDFFGSEPKDICSLIVEQGEVVGFARATSASDQQFGMAINDVAPGSSKGKVVMVRGVGDETTPQPPSAGFALVEAPWAFFGEGTPVASPQDFTFNPPPPPPGCSTVYGTLNGPLNRYEIKLPFKITDTCAMGTTYVLDFHADFSDNKSIHVDYKATLQSTSVGGASGLLCALEICDIYNDKMIDYMDKYLGGPLAYNIQCSISFNVVTGEMWLSFPNQPKPGVTYSKVWFYLKVC